MTPFNGIRWNSDAQPVLLSQGQRPSYPGQGVNPGQVPGQYAPQLPGNHLSQQQPYGNQTLGQFSTGMQSPQQVQASQNHSSMAMQSPGINSQMGSQPMQSGQAVPGHYGVMGQGHNMNLQQRQGLGQLSTQMQGQYSSPVQNGPTNQHPGKILSFSML